MKKYFDFLAYEFPSLLSGVSNIDDKAHTAAMILSIGEGVLQETLYDFYVSGLELTEAERLAVDNAASFSAGQGLLVLECDCQDDLCRDLCFISNMEDNYYYQLGILHKSDNSDIYKDALVKRGDLKVQFSEAK